MDFAYRIFCSHRDKLGTIIKMNNYIYDSGLFFREISVKLINDITDFDVINLTLNLAIGLEKLLKGLLYDINPSYILINPEFKNSIQVLYKDKLLTEVESLSELTKNPNSDVITFSNSILRTQAISKTTFENKNLLFNISEARDIIAHCELKYFDIQKYKLLLLRDFYPLLNSYSTETNIRKLHFFDGRHIKLAKRSSSLQESLEKEISLLLDAHLNTWYAIKGSFNYTSDMEKFTLKMKDFPNNELVKCPSCENYAVLYLNPIYEFDPISGEKILIGKSIKKFRCQFCKLEVFDPKKLDLLNIKMSDDNPQNIEQKNETKSDII